MRWGIGLGRFGEEEEEEEEVRMKRKEEEEVLLTPLIDTKTRIEKRLVSATVECNRLSPSAAAGPTDPP